MEAEVLTQLVEDVSDPGVGLGFLAVSLDDEIGPSGLVGGWHLRRHYLPRARLIEATRHEAV